jgi:hypothetical protein
MTQNLIVFMCDTQYQTLQYAAWSGSFDFAYRSFIITGEPMQVSEQKWLKKTDFVLNLNNNSKDRLEIALRASLLYSSPKFENIIFIYDQNLPNSNEIKKAFEEISKKYNFKKINNCLCFAREYVVLNGFNLFDDTEAIIESEESYDVVSLGVEVGNALMGNPVKTIPFVEAIKEVILMDKFVLHQSLLMNLKDYQKFVDLLFQSNQNKQGPTSLTIVSEDIKDAEIEKIKKTMSPQGMILFFTKNQIKIQNPYKIIHHEDGIKAVLFR